MIKANELKELVKKFQETGDITKKESDKIYALFSKNCQATKMNPASSKVDVELLRAFHMWFAEVKKAVDEGRTGMFLSTVKLDYSHSFTEKLNPLDRISRFGAHGSLREKLPKELKGQALFPEINRAGWLRRYGLYDLVAKMEVAGKATDPEIKIHRLLNEGVDSPEDLIDILFGLSVDRLDIPCASFAVFPGLPSEKYLLPKEINKNLESVKNRWKPIQETLISSGVLKAYRLNDKKVYRINNKNVSEWESGVNKFIEVFKYSMKKEERIKQPDDDHWFEISR